MAVIPPLPTPTPPAPPHLPWESRLAALLSKQCCHWLATDGQPRGVSSLLVHLAPTTHLLPTRLWRRGWQLVCSRVTVCSGPGCVVTLLDSPLAPQGRYVSLVPHYIVWVALYGVGAGWLLHRGVEWPRLPVVLFSVIFTMVNFYNEVHNIPGYR